MIVDITCWQKDIDFYKLKEAGVEGVMIRSSYSGLREGQIYIDESFVTNCVNARAAGLKVGAYHDSSAVNAETSATEAEKLLEFLNQEKFDYPLAFCAEYLVQKRFYGQLLIEIVSAWCDTVQESGYEAMYYFDSKHISKLDLDTLSKYHLWIAHYDNDDEYDKWDNKIPALMRQYTLNGRFEDIPQTLNVSHYYKENENKRIAEEIQKTDAEEKATNSKDEFNVGDIVKIKPGSTTYSGKTIYSWVYNNTYKIDKLINDRAILDANGLCTAFNTKDLCKL